MRLRPTALGVALALAPAVTRADPAALRAPVAGRAAVATLGAPEMSAGFWLTQRFGLAVEWRLPRSAVGASAGARWRLFGEELGWGVDFHLALGFVVPLLEPAAALTVTPAVVGRWRGGLFEVATSVAAPAAVRVAPEAAVRIPLLLELWFGVHVGGLHAGLHGGVGNAYVSGLAWSAAFQGSAVLGWDL